jgi:hypothetical protein
MPHPGACQILSRVMVKDAETARAIPIDGIEQQQPPGGFRQGGEVNARCLLWANMSVISTAGARIDRRDNGRHLTPLSARLLKRQSSRDHAIPVLSGLRHVYQQAA